MNKLLSAVVVLSLLVGCSKSVSTGSGQGWSSTRQEDLDLRLEVVARYESWLKAQGFSSGESASSSSGTENGSVTWTSNLYSGQLPELGDVEVLIEKRDRVLTDRTVDQPADIHIHLRANVSQTRQAEEAWQRLDEEMKMLVTEGIYKAGEKVVPLPKK